MTKCKDGRPCGSCELKIKGFARKTGGRITKERISIMQSICNINGHFRAEDVQAALVKDGNHISLPTVYRNLPMLIAAGIIRRTSIYEEVENHASTYEHVFGKPHHDHLLCSRCGKRVEFNYPAIEVLQEAVAQEHGFRLTHHHLELVGECADCLGKNDIPEEAA
ncbi:MAG: Fur family transcriptional regulator [Myxococcota bacterium]|nr:Fur family transcriptional regulator [Myxococcota bacterium]